MSTKWSSFLKYHINWFIFRMNVKSLISSVRKKPIHENKSISSDWHWWTCKCWLSTDPLSWKQMVAASWCMFHHYVPIFTFCILKNILSRNTCLLNIQIQILVVLCVTYCQVIKDHTLDVAYWLLRCIMQ